MPEEPTYSRLVLRLAWANTWRIFKRKTFDVAFGIISLAIGCFIFDAVFGWSAVKEQIATFIAFVLAPGGLFLLFAFLWNVFLASDQLVYDAIKELPHTSAEQPQKTQPAAVNWEIWKRRAQYTIDEFSLILSKKNPQGLVNAEADAYRRLIIEEIERDELSYVQEYGYSLEGIKYEKSISGETKLEKKDALYWAEQQQLDVEHIK